MTLTNDSNVQAFKGQAETPAISKCEGDNVWIAGTALRQRQVLSKRFVYGSTVMGDGWKEILESTL